MKNSRLVFVVFVLFSIECISQIYVERIEIVTPTAKQEATSIWQTINNIDFFEKQGYTINLPTDALIDTLITKSKKGAFGNKDYNAIYNLVETKIFDPNNYHVAIRKVENQSDLIGSLVHEIEATKSQWDWEFKLFDTYKIIFTLYGTGGSYDPDKGTITLLTNREGDFINTAIDENTARINKDGAIYFFGGRMRSLGKMEVPIGYQVGIG